MKSLAAIRIYGFPCTMPEDAKKPEPKRDERPEPQACALPSGVAIAEDIRIRKSEEEWKRILSADQYRVLRQQGTEPPFRNAYWNHKEDGAYECAGCGANLFYSDRKFDSGTGWPSFFDASHPANLGKTVDTSHGMTRTEVHCSQCGGHLGHLFDDGPKPTGMRYCINSASIAFKPQE